MYNFIAKNISIHHLLKQILMKHPMKHMKKY